MAQRNWIAGSGNWNVKANWSGGQVPSIADDVIISTATSLTVTYTNGDSTILSLTTGADDLLDITGGILTVDGDTSLAGGLEQTGGALDLDGGYDSLTGGMVSQSGGTIDISSGELALFDTTNTIGGTIEGRSLLLDNGSTTLTEGAQITVSNLVVAGDIAILANFSYTGLLWSDGAFFLGANDVSLSGTSQLATTFNGAGTVTLNGQSQGYLSLSGEETIVNSGVFRQTGSITLGASNLDDTRFVNAAGATWVVASSGIDGAVDISSDGFAVVYNAGMMEIATGVTISVANFENVGTLLLDPGETTVINADGTAIFGGTIAGAGTLVLGPDAALTQGLDLLVGTVLVDDATLEAPLTYAGIWDETTGTLATDGSNLRLTGTVDFLAEQSAEPPATVTITGAGHVVLAGDTALDMTLANSSRITTTGTLHGHGVITGLFTNTGVIALDGGTLQLGGSTVTLDGTLRGNGTLLLQSSLYAGTITLAAGLHLGVSNLILSEDTLALAGNVRYGGGFTLGSDSTILPSGFALVLSGAGSTDGATIMGDGSVTSSGSFTVGGQSDGPFGPSLAIMGGARFINSGVMTWLGGTIALGLGSTDTAHFTNAATGTLYLGTGSDAKIFAYGGQVGFSNAGLVTTTDAPFIGGTFEVAVSNTGTILANRGDITFEGNVTGSGVIATENGGALTFVGAVSGGTVSLGTASELWVTYSASHPVFGDVISGFNLGDVIDVGGLLYSNTASLHFDGTSGILSVTSGGETEKLHMQGSYTSSSFHLFNDGGIVGLTHG